MMKLSYSKWADQGMPPSPPPNRRGRFDTSFVGSGGTQDTAAANITYQNGQVINNPQVYNIFIGNWSSAADQIRAKRLNQFITDLLGSTWMRTFAQYGCTDPGKFIKGLFIPKPSVLSSNDSDASIDNIVQTAISSGQIPEPAGDNNVVFLLFLDNDTGITDSSLGITMCAPTGNNAFGYHHYFVTNQGNNCYYAVIPGLTASCINTTCAGTLSGCSLDVNDTQEDRQTQVTSHELAEMITNPEGNGGWYDVTTGNEIGDICNGDRIKLTVGSNTWDIQQIYDKSTGTCVKSSTAAGISVASADTVATELQNKYNLLGGAMGLAVGVAIATHNKGGVIGIALWGLTGFIAGFVATDFGKRLVPPSDATMIKGEINKIL